MNCPVCGARCMRNKTGSDTGMQFTLYRCTQCAWDEEYDHEEPVEKGKRKK